jgi:thymidylate synthase
MSSGSIMIGASKPYIPFTQEEFINRIKTNDEFAKKWGELGPIYGKQWRSWGEEKQMDLDTSTVLRVENGIEKHPYKEFISKQGIDQIANLINDLKTNPDSRRLMVNAWNVGEIDQMVLPPCHFQFQVYTRELSYQERVGLTMFEEIKEEHLNELGVPKRAISLMWNQRSVDTGLGLGFNIASYGLLLEILAKEVNMVPDELIGNLGDVHLYLDHVEPIKEQLTREPFQLPKLKIKQHSIDEPSPLTKPQYWHPDDFVVENYQSHPTIKLPLSN